MADRRQRDRRPLRAAWSPRLRPRSAQPRLKRRCSPNGSATVEATAEPPRHLDHHRLRASRCIRLPHLCHASLRPVAETQRRASASSLPTAAQGRHRLRWRRRRGWARARARARARRWRWRWRWGLLRRGSKGLATFMRQPGIQQPVGTARRSSRRRRRRVARPRRHGDGGSWQPRRVASCAR